MLIAWAEQERARMRQMKQKWNRIRMHTIGHSINMKMSLTNKINVELLTQHKKTQWIFTFMPFQLSAMDKSDIC